MALPPADQASLFPAESDTGYFVDNVSFSSAYRNYKNDQRLFFVFVYEPVAAVSQNLGTVTLILNLGKFKFGDSDPNSTRRPSDHSVRIELGSLSPNFHRIRVTVPKLCACCAVAAANPRSGTPALDVPDGMRRSARKSGTASTFWLYVAAKSLPPYFSAFSIFRNFLHFSRRRG